MPRRIRVRVKNAALKSKNPLGWNMKAWKTRTGLNASEILAAQRAYKKGGEIGLNRYLERKRAPRAETIN